MAKFGYARVSTSDQNLDLQEDALKKYGCEKIFFEKVSGKNLERPQLKKALETLRAGDEFVFFKLDRLARSVKDLIELVEIFKELKVDFVSLSDGLNTASATGKFTFHVMGAVAELERNLASERTKAGLASARERGKFGGKPKGLSLEAQKKAVRGKKLYDAKDLTVEEICKTLEIGSKATFYKYLKYENERLAKLEQ